MVEGIKKKHFTESLDTSSVEELLLIKITICLDATGNGLQRSQEELRSSRKAGEVYIPWLPKEERSFISSQNTCCSTPKASLHEPKGKKAGEISVGSDHNTNSTQDWADMNSLGRKWGSDQSWWTPLVCRLEQNFMWQKYNWVYFAEYWRQLRSFFPLSFNLLKLVASILRYFSISLWEQMHHFLV